MGYSWCGDQEGDSISNVNKINKKIKKQKLKEIKGIIGRFQEKKIRRNNKSTLSFEKNNSKGPVYQC